MDIVYETERLLLKVFEPTDLEDVKSFWGNEEVMVHCLGAIPQELLPKVISSYTKCHEKMGISVYAVVDKKTMKVIGGAGFNVTTSPESVELLYHFAKESWGKGYATEAASACVQIAKANGKTKTIFASADPQNNTSLKVLEKIGFHYKGLKWTEDTKQNEPYYEMSLG